VLEIAKKAFFERKNELLFLFLNLSYKVYDKNVVTFISIVLFLDVQISLLFSKILEIYNKLSCTYFVFSSSSGSLPVCSSVSVSSLLQ